MTQHHELMLISDMCLAYRNDEEYYKCLHAHEENSIENIHGWRQVQWECGVNLMYKTGKDLYPQDRNCCPWTKHILLQNQKAFDWNDGPVDYCGITIENGKTSDGSDDHH